MQKIFPLTVCGISSALKHAENIPVDFIWDVQCVDTCGNMPVDFIWDIQCVNTCGKCMCAGDILDRGNSSLRLVRLLKRLKDEAGEAVVIVFKLLGNHEVHP